MAAVRQFSVLPQRNSVGFNPDMQTFVNEMPLVIGDMNNVAVDINNNALQILGQTNSATLDALIAAKFSAVSPVNQIFVDGNAGAGGTGTSGNPFNDIRVALEACVSGQINVINLKVNQIYTIGTGSEGVNDKIYFEATNTTILFNIWGTGTNPKILVNYTSLGTNSISPLSLYTNNKGSKLKVLTKNVDIQLVNNADNYPPENYQAFLYGGLGGEISLAMHSGKLILGSNTALMTPYIYNKGNMGLYLYGVELSGTGKIIQDSSYNLKNIHLVNVTRTGTPYVLSHKRSDLAELQTNVPTLSYLSEVTV